MTKITWAATLWAAAFIAVISVGAQTPKSVNEGVYTSAQAARGEKTFTASCTTCHDKARFTGKDFLSVWTGRSIHVLFDHMHTTMPEDNPGSLKPQEYADIVAFFLKLNGYPEGKEELQPTAETLKGIRFDNKK